MIAVKESRIEESTDSILGITFLLTTGEVMLDDHFAGALIGWYSKE